MQCERKKEARTGGRELEGEGMLWRLLMKHAQFLGWKGLIEGRIKSSNIRENIERSLGFPTTQMSHSQRGSVDLGRVLKV